MSNQQAHYKVRFGKVAKYERVGSDGEPDTFGTSSHHSQWRHWHDTVLIALQTCHQYVWVLAHVSALSAYVVKLKCGSTWISPFKAEAKLITMKLILLLLISLVKRETSSTVGKLSGNKDWQTTIPQPALSWMWCFPEATSCFHPYNRCNKNKCRNHGKRPEHPNL